MKKLPIGIDIFEKLREDVDAYYYVDKTGLIKDLLENVGEVNLFTRPRRFGKSLNMSMLKSFFELGSDPKLFTGLAIMQEKELCAKYMGKYPVISITLKDIWQESYEQAVQNYAYVLSDEVRRHIQRMDVELLDSDMKNYLLDMQKGITNPEFALHKLTEILHNFYKQKVIVLIDEYDVPLQKAQQNGYYQQMVGFISRVFSSCLKTNGHVQFAVVTGCLRISKESIFTGFNNPKIHSILNNDYSEWFGFTEAEVRDMLAYYDKSEYFELTKQWYNGYLFGDTNVYNPWDVINWCYSLAVSQDDRPRPFWANTSENSIVRQFAEMADDATRDELAVLLQGGSVTKKIKETLVYGELYESIENVWSVLLMTGYLTYKAYAADQDEYELVLPNYEVRKIMQEDISEWFKRKIAKSESALKKLYAMVDAGDAKGVQLVLNRMLRESISYYDGGKQADKEAFYHGMLFGMFSARAGWQIKSNREAGSGRLDIATYDSWGDDGLIIEIKYAKTPEELEHLAKVALQQIKDKDYEAYFDGLGLERIQHLGVAFHKKMCVVVM